MILNQIRLRHCRLDLVEIYNCCSEQIRVYGSGVIDICFDINGVRGIGFGPNKIEICVIVYWIEVKSTFYSCLYFSVTALTALDLQRMLKEFL
jgi:hypothetical protein